MNIFFLSRALSLPALLCLYAIITMTVWGYAAFGCVSRNNQIAGLFIRLMGIPIYAFYRLRPATLLK